MNTTANGRWGRYKEIDGERHKLCNGMLHDEEGAWLPMHSFWVHKSGTRKGKPMSQCVACQKAYRGFDPEVSGLIEVERVAFVFEEIKRRIGKAEAVRRLGVSRNLWIRIENRTYTKMYRRTVRDAMLLLRELRDNDVVYSKRSIHRGSLARGEEPQPPDNNRDFYISQGDADNERRRKDNALDPNIRAKWRARRLTSS